MDPFTLDKDLQKASESESHEKESEEQMHATKLRDFLRSSGDHDGDDDHMEDEHDRETHVIESALDYAFGDSREGEEGEQEEGVISSLVHSIFGDSRKEEDPKEGGEEHVIDSALDFAFGDPAPDVEKEEEETGEPVVTSVVHTWMEEHQHPHSSSSTRDAAEKSSLDFVMGEFGIDLSMDDDDEEEEEDEEQEKKKEGVQEGTDPPVVGP